MTWADEAIGPQGPDGPPGGPGAPGAPGAPGTPGDTETESLMMASGSYGFGSTEVRIVSIGGVALNPAVQRYQAWARVPIASSTWSAGTERIRCRIRISVTTYYDVAGSRMLDAVLSNVIGSAAEDSILMKATFDPTVAERSAGAVWLILTGQRATGTGSTSITPSQGRTLCFGFGPVTAGAITTTAALMMDSGDAGS